MDKCCECNKPATHEVMVSVEARDERLVYKIGVEEVIGIFKSNDTPLDELLMYCDLHLPLYDPFKRVGNILVSYKYKIRMG